MSLTIVPAFIHYLQCASPAATRGQRRFCLAAASANSSRRSRDERRQHFKGTTQGVRLQGDVIFTQDVIQSLHAPDMLIDCKGVRSPVSGARCVRDDFTVWHPMIQRNDGGEGGIWEWDGSSGQLEQWTKIEWITVDAVNYRRCYCTWRPWHTCTLHNFSCPRHAYSVCLFELCFPAPKE